MASVPEIWNVFGSSDTHFHSYSSSPVYSCVPLKWNVVVKQFSFLKWPYSRSQWAFLTHVLLAPLATPVQQHLPSGFFSFIAFFSVKYAPNGPTSTCSDWIFTTYFCRAMSIRICGNQFCHWETQSVRVWGEAKNVQQGFATLSVGCIVVCMQEPSVGCWITR